MQTATISGLYVYPIKSCGVLEVTKTKLAEFGLQYDREWVIVNREGTVLTQRDARAMALIEPQVDDSGTMTLTAPHMIPLVVPTNNAPGQSRNIEVWGNACAGFDQGDEPAQWLSDYLGMPVRLLRNDKQMVRLGRVPNNPGFTPRVAFADSMPYLIVSQESLTDLNGRLSEPVEMSRFRPSIVINGLGAYAEDEAQRLQLGTVTLTKTKPCARCVIVTIEQSTGELKGPEPLRTLSEYRRSGEKVVFGQYFASENEQSAWLSVGDEVKVV